MRSCLPRIHDWPRCRRHTTKCGPRTRANVRNCGRCAPLLPFFQTVPRDFCHECSSRSAASSPSHGVHAPASFGKLCTRCRVVDGRTGMPARSCRWQDHDCPLTAAPRCKRSEHRRWGPVRVCERRRVRCSRALCGGRLRGLWDIGNGDSERNLRWRRPPAHFVLSLFLCCVPHSPIDTNSKMGIEFAHDSRTHRCRGPVRVCERRRVRCSRVLCGGRLRGLRAGTDRLHPTRRVPAPPRVSEQLGDRRKRQSPGQGDYRDGFQASIGEPGRSNFDGRDVRERCSMHVEDRARGCHVDQPRV